MQRISILLIDDDEEDRFLLQKILTRITNARYELEYQSSYDSGLQRMLEDRHDLCMLDYRLGARNGIELLKEARQKGYTRPIVLLTGADESEIDIQALQAGADDYISKSHLQGELLQRIIRYTIERKKAEHERERLLREQIASKELERKKNEFIGMVVHELKTPLTSLKGFAQLLSRKLAADNNPQISQLVNRIDAQSNKLTTLIDDLLDVTRIEGGTFQFEEEPFSFDELVEEIVDDIHLTTATHTLVRQGKLGKPVYADRKRIGQVITNFLTNAIKYAPDADTIIVRTELNELKQEVIFSVQDTGPGIPFEKQEKIFEPFYRIERSDHRHAPGLGLGLFISAEIIRGEHGKIWVESIEGNGSTFSFTLPLNRQVAA
jgi:signal transduction histidine kinase